MITSSATKRIEVTLFDPLSTNHWPAGALWKRTCWRNGQLLSSRRALATPWHRV